MNSTRFYSRKNQRRCRRLAVLLLLLGSLCAHALSADQTNSPPRAILDAAKVPAHFRTGRFRSARWDGGPIEAEKGRLSGWPNFTADDPRQVLQATRDWYNPKTIAFLKKAHINWAWVTWSVGFSPETEREQQALVARYIELCHQNHIRVAAYFSIGNVFWKDMFEKLPESIAWVDRLEDGGPRFYTRPNRYMADISHPDWMALQKARVEAALRAGADALWIDNTFAYYGREKVTRFLDAIHEVAARINPQIVIMSNYNRGILTWGRLQNGVTTEDGDEPGYYEDRAGSPLVTNAGLLRHQYAVGEGWRPVSVEFGGRHNGDRMTTPMAPHKWQLAIAECAMYGVSLEPYFEGLFLRDLYFGLPEALKGLEAIGTYNAFLERHEEYYAQPESLARAAIVADTTDAVLPYLTALSAVNLNYDVIFNYQPPTREKLEPYRVLALPNTNPVSVEWAAALMNWVEDGGTLIAVQDASIFAPGAIGPSHEMLLGPILGISRRNLPTELHEHQRGKGLAVYLPQLPAASEMAKLIRNHLGRSELVEVEARPAVLSNLAYQRASNRVILHLLNYRQDRQQNIRVRVRRPVSRVEVYSPDMIADRQAKVEMRDGEWEIVVPELRTYNLVAIYISGKKDSD
jgi:hypothetical protein